MQYARKPDGRPCEFADEEIDKMAKKLEEMILVASQEYRVTAQRLEKEIRLNASAQRTLKALHTRDLFPP